MIGLTPLEKVKNQTQRKWYAQATAAHGWSRAVLVHQIESDLYRRQETALTNFHTVLPAPQSPKKFAKIQT
jgi:predicted nuclease of restriction endonuclease-like (RecB) superfamily